MLNNVCLVGRLTADPEIASFNGTSRAGFTLAVKRTYTPKGQEKQADFIPIKAWGKTADLVGKFCHKGMQVGIEGSLQQHTWTSQDGTNRSMLEVSADKVHFIEPKSESEKAQVSQGSPEDYSEIDLTDDLPF